MRFHAFLAALIEIAMLQKVAALPFTVLYPIHELPFPTAHRWQAEHSARCTATLQLCVVFSCRPFCLTPKLPSIPGVLASIVCFISNPDGFNSCRDHTIEGAGPEGDGAGSRAGGAQRSLPGDSSTDQRLVCFTNKLSPSPFIMSCKESFV